MVIVAILPAILSLLVFVGLVAVGVFHLALVSRRTRPFLLHLQLRVLAILLASCILFGSALHLQVSGVLVTSSY